MLNLKSIKDRWADARSSPENHLDKIYESFNDIPFLIEEIERQRIEIWTLREEATANANLVASAHDLLEIAIRAAVIMDLYGTITNWPREMPHQYVDMIDELRVVIAKATSSV